MKTIQNEVYREKNWKKKMNRASGTLGKKFKQPSIYVTGVPEE